MAGCSHPPPSGHKSSTPASFVLSQQWCSMFHENRHCVLSPLYLQGLEASLAHSRSLLSGLNGGLVQPVATQRSCPGWGGQGGGGRVWRKEGTVCDTPSLALPESSRKAADLWGPHQRVLLDSASHLGLANGGTPTCGFSCTQQGERGEGVRGGYDHY